MSRLSLLSTRYFVMYECVLKGTKKTWTITLHGHKQSYLWIRLTFIAAFGVSIRFTGDDTIRSGLSLWCKKMYMYRLCITLGLNRNLFFSYSFTLFLSTTSINNRYRNEYQDRHLYTLSSKNSIFRLFFTIKKCSITW